MEAYRGPGRGSYIWGRSVHNTRIERLWYDVTNGFGQKWKNFFIELETHCHLNAHNPGHIWLLHYLFKDAINEDATDWVRAWNRHVMQLKGSQNRSPFDMYLFSLINDGARGLDEAGPPEDAEPVGELAEYGIDWAASSDPKLMDHLLEREPEEWNEVNPFLVQPHTGPQAFSQVPCDPPSGPLNPWEVQELNLRLQAAFGGEVASRNMEVRRLIWITAFEICHSIMERRQTAWVE
ncbi:hypothetical protein C8Q76DRAFT_634347 [Earliella scabrosa]|nr:hypothetical protein C8Q76DRAFT_634347 [Earliella scabrosa]